MLTKTHFKILVGALVPAIFAMAAIAYGKTTVTFPVAELGNCANQTACQQYCNKPGNIVACTDFGEQHGIISSQDAQKNRVLADSIKNGGPGGCTSEVQCTTYCAVAAHGQECLSFAQGHGLIASQDADRGIKIAQLMASGKAPGGCTSQTTCQQYCSQGAHIDECATFGVQNGLLTQAQADNFKVTRGVGPGGCQDQSCQTYCQTHQAECLKFAQDHQLVPQDQINKIQVANQKNADIFTRLPDGVKTCLQTAYGSDLSDQISNNQFQFDSAFSDQLSTCYQDYLKAKQTGTEPPSSSQEATPSDTSPPDQTDTPDVQPSDTPDTTLQQRTDYRNQLEHGPAPVLACLKATYGDDVLDQVQRGDLAIDSNLTDTVSGCLQDYQNSLTPSPTASVSPTSPQPSPNMNPSTVCGQMGGTWNGSTCIFSGTPPPNMPIPGMNPSVMCAQSGGVWNGSTCLFNTPAPTPMSAVACSPSTQYASTGVPVTVTVTATGGTGTYNWSVVNGSNTASGTGGGSFTTTFFVIGTGTFTVSSGGTSAICTVNISLPSKSSFLPNGIFHALIDFFSH